MNNYPAAEARGVEGCCPPSLSSFREECYVNCSFQWEVGYVMLSGIIAAFHSWPQIWWFTKCWWDVCCVELDGGCNISYFVWPVFAHRWPEGSERNEQLPGSVLPTEAGSLGVFVGLDQVQICRMKIGFSDALCCWYEDYSTMLIYATCDMAVWYRFALSLLCCVTAHQLGCSNCSQLLGQKKGNAIHLTSIHCGLNRAR